MVTRATRYPVLVDPQGQGRTWIMHREEANQLKITQLNDKLFRNHLEVCRICFRCLADVHMWKCCENLSECLDLRCCKAANYFASLASDVIAELPIYVVANKPGVQMSFCLMTAAF